MNLLVRAMVSSFVVASGRPPAGSLPKPGRWYTDPEGSAVKVPERSGSVVKSIMDVAGITVKTLKPSFYTLLTCGIRSST
ncbi:hypothetical protein [Sediminivirga luteola]|uniref:hypothetical protein n=1 Tax=Sediminivirga luteola TaxID=1774748 RepID=UPI001F56CEF9|nr:hypothetical protein [Sediminivirga luteola]MCI2264326.1 hypothetical protein [Sediminivirga luteola]